MHAQSEDMTSIRRRVAWRCVGDFADQRNRASDWPGHDRTFEPRDGADDPVAEWLGATPERALTVLHCVRAGWSPGDRCNGAWGVTPNVGLRRRHCEGQGGRG